MVSLLEGVINDKWLLKIECGPWNDYWYSITCYPKYSPREKGNGLGGAVEVLGNNDSLKYMVPASLHVMHT